MKFYCKQCLHCEQMGRQNSTWSSVGRKRYYCKHEGISNIRDKHGFLIDGFVGFGENNWKSPLTLKTSPRWCPKKNSEKVNKEVIKDIRQECISFDGNCLGGINQDGCSKVDLCMKLFGNNFRPCEYKLKELLKRVK